MLKTWWVIIQKHSTRYLDVPAFWQGGYVYCMVPVYALDAECVCFCINYWPTNVDCNKSWQTTLLPPPRLLKSPSLQPLLYLYPHMIHLSMMAPFVHHRPWVSLFSLKMIPETRAKYFANAHHTQTELNIAAKCILLGRDSSMMPLIPTLLMQPQNMGN